jgi:hypothetical protein
VSATLGRSPDAADAAAPGDLSASPTPQLTLGSLPLGARLVLRCRKDWRAAAVAAFEPELARVVLSVASPSGHTYRLRRPADAALTLDGPVPVLGEGGWRPGLARYERRW